MISDFWLGFNKRAESMAKKPKNSEDKIRIIYLDMDGVLADFEGHFKEISGGLTAKQYIKSKGQNGTHAMWMLIDKDKDFFAKLKPFSHAKELVRLCRKIAPTIILSSPPVTNRERAIENKREWLDNYIGHIPAIFSNNKKEYANKSALLIDDFKENTESFQENGGRVLLFKDFDSTRDFLENAYDKGLGIN